MSKSGIELCESPMETKLAEAFATQLHFEWRKSGDSYQEIGRWPGWWMALLAQVQSPIGRVDFSIGSTFPKHINDPEWWVIVEVDGHDYHERTKEQARRDRSRDRWYQARSTQILRFTGQEVWRDANACAQEALRLCAQLQQPILDREFAKFMKSDPTRRAPK